MGGNNDCLFSVYINTGYIIDIVLLSDQGLWTIQIIGPDLGSNRGKIVSDSPYNVHGFARSGVTFCIAYIFGKQILERIQS